MIRKYFTTATARLLVIFNCSIQHIAKLTQPRHVSWRNAFIAEWFRAGLRCASEIVSSATSVAQTARHESLYAWRVWRFFYFFGFRIVRAFELVRVAKVEVSNETVYLPLSLGSIEGYVSPNTNPLAVHLLLFRCCCFYCRSGLLTKTNVESNGKQQMEHKMRTNDEQFKSKTHKSTAQLVLILCGAYAVRSHPTRQKLSGTNNSVTLLLQRPYRPINNKFIQYSCTCYVVRCVFDVNVFAAK